MQEIKIPEGCKASIDFEKRVVVIEREQPKFKKGDILYIQTKHCNIRFDWIAIYNGLNSNIVQYFSAIGVNEVQTKDPLKSSGLCDTSNIEVQILATPSEQQLLFDALAKEGKKWNAITLQIEDIEKDILVPENIGIYKYNDPHEYGGGDNLFIGFNDNTQLLGYCADRWVAYPNIYNNNKKVQCKLTPCKQSDLKAGDTGMCLSIKDIFSDISDYIKILEDGGSRFAYITEDLGVNVISELDGSEFYFYKVEPINK